MVYKIVYSRGFELLSKRKQNHSPEVFCEKSGVILPPVYKIFTSSFDIENMKQGDFLSVNKQRVRISQAIYCISDLYDADKDEICFMNYISPQQMLTNPVEEDNLERAELYPIVECLHGGVVCVGYGRNNRDEIYVELPSMEIKYLCKNIFCFQFNLGLVFLDQPFHGIDLSKVYKSPFSEDYLMLK